jgi:valyl-tRNA synthetase
VLDPHRKKMSKSVGNVVTPSQWIEKYGADAVRYWSGSARLGVDTSFDENVLKVGRRLVTKIFNAAKFVYQQEAAPGVPTEELDLGLLHRLSELVERATAAHERFDYSFGLSETESFFWNAFTDNYIELSKDRLRGGGQRAASATGSLHLGLSVMLRLFAPVLPYITEEVWSWRLAGETSVDSIHRAPWPSQADFAGIEPPRNAASFAVALSAIAAVRKYKSSQEVSMMAPLAQLEFRVHPEAEAALRVVLRDVVATARAHDATVLADETLARGEVGVEARLLAR